VKMTKLSFPYCCSFGLEHHIENMGVVMNSLSLLLSMSPTKFSLIPDTFSFVVDKSWSFTKITPMEKMHK
jgi:hypothetical protein